MDTNKPFGNAFFKAMLASAADICSCQLCTQARANNQAENGRADSAAPTVSGMADTYNQQRQPDEPKTISCTIRVIADMPFADALARLLDGGRLSRHGWGGPGDYVELVGPDPFGMGQAAHFSRRTSDGRFAPWLPEFTDLLATDWAQLPPT